MFILLIIILLHKEPTSMFILKKTNKPKCIFRVQTEIIIA